ncbi:MAG TPA: DUF998 domain-containing protein [Myxococcota bacterium]|nr:DUF998 domain-containing protein [Myxococcota bacterium]
MAPPRNAALCGFGAVALALATPLLAAAARPEYDACAQYISELGERGAPHELLVRFAGFLPIGLLALGFSTFAAVAAEDRRARTGFALFSGVGGAYVVAAFFPCDPGCPSPGSTTQQVHSASALLEYLGGGIGLLWLSPARDAGSRALARLARASGVVALIAFAGLLTPQLAPLRGAVQRVAELALFGWVLAYCVDHARHREVAGRR